MDNKSRRTGVLFAAFIAIIHILCVIIYFYNESEGFKHIEYIGVFFPLGSYRDWLTSFILGPISLIDLPFSSISAGYNLFLIAWYIAIIISWLSCWQYRNRKSFTCLLILILLWIGANGLMIYAA